MAVKSSPLKQQNTKSVSPDAVASSFITLKKRSDFLSARKGSLAHMRSFVLQLNKRDENPDHFRIGLTVTKKVGNAVQRNRVKRRLRAVCKTLPIDPSLSGYDLVVIARPNALAVPFEALVSQLNDGLEKALRNDMRSRVANQKASGQKPDQADG